MGGSIEKDPAGFKNLPGLTRIQCIKNQSLSRESGK